MKKSIIYLMTLGVLVSCVGELQDVRNGSDKLERPSEELISTKVVNTSFNALPGSIIVKTAKGGVLDLSGVEYDPFEMKGIEKVFPVKPKYADKHAELELDSWYVLRFSEKYNLNDAAKLLSASEQVEKIQFNHRMRNMGGDEKVVSTRSMASSDGGNAVFNDPYLSKQWNYINTGSTSMALTAREGADVNVKDAWKITTGDPSIVVAVVDQGVQVNHPDLAANMWVNEGEIPGNGIDDDGNGYIDDVHGYNFVKDKGEITWASAKGDNGHGTHVAGTVAAVNNNGIGVCGIAGGNGTPETGVRIMSCQVFNGAEGGDAVSVARAIVYAADNGAIILQASLGSDAGLYGSDTEYVMYNSLQTYAMQYFMLQAECPVMKGGVLIFSAGNDAEGVSCYPAAHADLISVAAIGPDYLPATYTNYGPGVNICAPGGDGYLNNASAAPMILSTMPTELTEEGYGYIHGTSMACPHVSGVAALGLSYVKKLGTRIKRDDFVNLLLASVNDMEVQMDRSKAGLDMYDYQGGMGTGAVDAWKMLMNVEGVPCIFAPVGKEAHLDLSPVMGGSPSLHNKYHKVDITVPYATKLALGVEGIPVFEHGRLKIKCTKSGCAKIKVGMVIDYKEATQSAYTSSTYVEREISIIARGGAAANGGWL